MSFVRVDSGLLYRGAHPYRYVGANLWSAAWLPPERLGRELDRLTAAGVSNVRIMASAEGGVGRSSHIEPPMQPTIGEYDETVLRGLDAAVHQIGARGMTAVLVLGNMWQWSGGFASYVAWATGESAPLMTSTAQDADWQAHQNFASRFYGSAAAVQAWRSYVEHLLGRTNTASGVPYAADETIMAWQLCNEPRPLTHGREYLAWIEASAALLKSLAPHTLVSLGSEGPTPWPDYTGTDVTRDHAHVDYVSIHTWPQNWQWYDPAHANVQAVTSRSLAYAALALRHATAIGKPLVVDGFGLARDGGSLDPAAATAHRDVYYGAMCEGLAALGPAVAGLNFWAWGGEARPGEGAFIGDPPHEPQGWYSVYDADASTHTVLRLCAALFAPAPAPPPASQCRSDMLDLGRCSPPAPLLLAPPPPPPSPTPPSPMPFCFPPFCFPSPPPPPSPAAAAAAATAATAEDLAPTPAAMPCCIEHRFSSAGEVESSTCFSARNPFAESTLADLCPSNGGVGQQRIFRDCRSAARSAGRCHDWSGIGDRWSCDECSDGVHGHPGVYFANVGYASCPTWAVEQLKVEAARGGQCAGLTFPQSGAHHSQQHLPLWLVASVLVASAFAAGVLCCVRRSRRGTGDQGKPLARAAAGLRAAVELAQHKQQGGRLEERADLVTERQAEKASTTTREPVMLVVTGIIKKAGRRDVPTKDAQPPPAYHGCADEGAGD